MDWLSTILQIIPIAVKIIESIKGGSSGPNKQAMVREAVLGSVAGLQLIADKGTADQKAIAKSIDTITNGVVALLNATEWKQ